MEIRLPWRIGIRFSSSFASLSLAALKNRFPGFHASARRVVDADEANNLFGTGEQVTRLLGFQLRSGPVAPEHAGRAETVAMRGRDVDRAIADHDGRRGHETPVEQLPDLLPFLRADLAAAHEAEIRPQAEHLENLLGEVDALRRTDAQRN